MMSEFCNRQKLLRIGVQENVKSVRYTVYIAWRTMVIGGQECGCRLEFSVMTIFTTTFNT